MNAATKTKLCVGDVYELNWRGEVRARCGSMVKETGFLAAAGKGKSSQVLELKSGFMKTVLHDHYLQ